MGPSCGRAVLGPPWEPLGSRVGRLGTIFGAPWETEEACMSKLHVGKRDDACLLQLYRRSSGSTLG
eukprot:764816-Pyramimonas_sp.AAC.1